MLGLFRSKSESSNVWASPIDVEVEYVRKKKEPKTLRLYAEIDSLANQPGAFVFGLAGAEPKPAEAAAAEPGDADP